MMPGFRGMNPKQLQRMMKQLGVDVKEIEGVQEVIIRTPAKEYVFKDASVTIMNAQGSTTYQITGDPAIRELGAAGDAARALPPATPAAPAASFTDDDVKLVAAQAGVPLEKARRALEECEGKPADAILKLVGEG